MTENSKVESHENCEQFVHAKCNGHYFNNGHFLNKEKRKSKKRKNSSIF